jgi:purine nucleosidase
VLTRAERVARFRALGTRVGTAVAELLDFFERFDEAKYGTDGGPLHDPNVIAWLVEPGLYAGRTVNVEVECSSELTMGQTVIDWWGVTARPRNVHVVREVDDAGFFRLLTERIARL